MNKLAIITSFLGGVKNRYMQYNPNRTLEEKFEIAKQVERLDGLELCFPADFEDVNLLKTLLADNNFGVSAINVRSRRQDKWIRGSFTSEDKKEREEVADEFKQAMDLAHEVGTTRLSTCPLNDGHDYVFEMNYLDAYKYAEETFSSICDYDSSIKLCIEYKINDPRTRCLFGSAGETLSFCQSVGANNLGVTMDFGHSVLAGERPAQALSMLHLAGKLFYVHLNDNDRNWDWDLLPGAYQVNELIEFLYYLRKVGYLNDWFAYDVVSKEVDTVAHFSLVTKLTRKFEDLATKIDINKMDSLMKKRNPNDTFEYFVDSVY
jgi:xylose isomerase